MSLTREWAEAIRFSAQTSYRSREAGIAIFQLHTNQYYYTRAVWQSICRRHTELVGLYGHGVTLLLYVKYRGNPSVIKSVLEQEGARFITPRETIGNIRQSFKLRKVNKKDMISAIILYCMQYQ